MAKPRDLKKLSVFLAESMNAKDMYRGDLEGKAIEEILKLLGVRVISKTVTDKDQLSKAIGQARKKGFAAFHLSCHANRRGLELTSDPDLSWADFAKIAGSKLKGMILCLSACKAGNKAVAKELQKHKSTPTYIVGPKSQLSYPQACVAWTVFYYYLGKKGIGREHIRCALHRMNRAVDTDFIYRHWDGEKYLRYPPAKQKRART